MSLRSDIAAWDTKSAKAMTKVYAAHSRRASFVRELVGFMQEEELQTGCTWLLKHHFEQVGADLDAKQTRDFFRYLAGLVPWEARLHALQCLPFLTIPSGSAKKLSDFLEDCVMDEAKFVRAWAYGGFGELAAQHPRSQPEVWRRLEAAMEAETAASVRVQIRRALERGG